MHYTTVDDMKNKNALRLTAITTILLCSMAASAAIDYKGISTPVRSILCGIWDGFLILAVSLAALVFVAAGIQWIYNADDPGKRKAAKDIIVHVIIGLIVVGISNELAKSIGVSEGCK